MGRIIPAENWGPYRLLWQRILPLSRPPRPYTHLMRERPALILPAMGLLLVVFLLWGGRRWWPVLLAFLLGSLAGHVWW